MGLQDLKDLLFESIILEKYHRVAELVRAGVDTSARKSTPKTLLAGVFSLPLRIVMTMII